MSAPSSFAPKNGVSSDSMNTNYSGDTQSSSSSDLEPTVETLEYFQTFADESTSSGTEQEEEEEDEEQNNYDYGYEEELDKNSNVMNYISPEITHPLKSSYLGSLSSGGNSYKTEEGNKGSSSSSMSQSVPESSATYPPVGSDVLEAHPPPPPSDLNILQAHENDVEEEGSTVLEQSVSALISESANSVVGSKSIKFYVDSLQKMQIAISSTERSLTRAAYEKEKAAERIVQIRAKAAKEINEIETLMLSKLQDAQNTFVSQRNDMINTMKSDIEIETDREALMINLVSTIDLVLATKGEDIMEYMSIVDEIESVRARIRDGTVASQLDLALEKNKELIAIDTKLCEELTRCKEEAESIQTEAKRRRKKMETLVTTLKVPDIATAGDSDFDFSQIKEVELLLQEAGRSANRSNKKINDIQTRFDDALRSRILFTGETMPERLNDNKVNTPPQKMEQQSQQVPGFKGTTSTTPTNNEMPEFASIGKSVLDGALDLLRDPKEFRMPWDSEQEKNVKDSSKKLMKSFEKTVKDFKISNPFTDIMKSKDEK